MKKWEYKIVPLRSMVKDASNHNIDVSVENKKATTEKLQSTMEGTLNKLGGEGWELVGSYKEFLLLKKEDEE